MFYRWVQTPTALGLINHEVARLDAHLNVKDTVNTFTYVCCGSILTSDNVLVVTKVTTVVKLNPCSLVSQCPLF